MARGVNKVILVGTLGKDPEMKYAANGNAIANISVATSESWNDKATGEKQEKTEWHRVVLFGKIAEIAGQYLKKGSQVYLEGKLQTRKWQDTATGQDRYSTEVVIDSINGVMQMLGGPRDSNGASDGSNQGYAAQPQNVARPAPPQGMPAAQQQPYVNGYPVGQGHSTAPMDSQNAPLNRPQNPLQQAPNYDTGFDEDLPF